MSNSVNLEYKKALELIEQSSLCHPDRCYSNPKYQYLFEPEPTPERGYAIHTKKGKKVKYKIVQPEYKPFLFFGKYFRNYC